MKKLATIAIALFVALSAIPAMAGDLASSTSTFQAFSNLPAAQRDTLTPLTDKELATIEGGQSCNSTSGANSSSGCNVSASQTAYIYQYNTANGNTIGSGSINQYNWATIKQSIRQNVVF